MWKLPEKLSNSLRETTLAHAAADWPLTISQGYVESDLNHLLESSGGVEESGIAANWNPLRVSERDGTLLK